MVHLLPDKWIWCFRFKYSSFSLKASLRRTYGMCENKVFDVHIQKLLKFLIHLSGLIYCAIYNVWVDVLSGKEGVFIWSWLVPWQLRPWLKSLEQLYFKVNLCRIPLTKNACMMHISLHYTGTSQDSDAAFPTNFFVNKWLGQV